MADASSTYAAIHLAKRPSGHIVEGETFSVRTHNCPNIEGLRDGEVIVRALYLSIDPAMRGWLDDDRSYLPPVEIGEVMRGQGLAVVEASRSEHFPPGSLGLAMTGWSEVAQLHEKALTPLEVLPSTQITDWLGVLGFTGLAAYFGMLDIGQVRSGDLVVITGAAGATGSVAGQIAKLKGATVIGIAGSDDKVAWLETELGFDKALNYKSPHFKAQFLSATEQLIDVFFDNVGGEILDLALTRAKMYARFVMCGGVSQHNTTETYGVKNYMKIVRLRIRMEGFIVLDYRNRFAEARSQLAEWLRLGAIKRKETVVGGGLLAAEKALLGLYQGDNTGRCFFPKYQLTADSLTLLRQAFGGSHSLQSRFNSC
jgi:NADPH-dependent curcumin reductase CurA